MEEQERKTRHIGLKLQPSVHEEIVANAARQYLEFSAYLRKLIQEGLAREREEVKA